MATPARRREVRTEVGRRVAPVEVGAAAAEGRLDTTETTNVSQQGQLGNLSARISEEATTNNAQGLVLENHTNRLNGFGVRITDLEAANRNQAATIKTLQEQNASQSKTISSLVNRIKALEDFRNRPSGFASSATNNGGANHTH